jgi:dCMP deaminase
MKPKYIKAHMRTAENYAGLSTARRLQVGAILVKEDRIISIGYNGMPAGWDNDCEDKEWCSAGGWLSAEEIEASWPYEGEYIDSDGNKIQGRYRLKTKAEVLHAEANAIAKVARSPESAEDAVMFVTHAPCMECAKLIFQSGIKQVFWRHNYRSDDGLNFLRQAGVTTNKVEE